MLLPSLFGLDSDGLLPDGLRIIGTAKNKAAVLSFMVDGVHPHDVAQILDWEGVAIRAGHHCAQPLMRRFGVSGTTRASFYFYNTIAEIDAFADAHASVAKQQQHIAGEIVATQ